MPLPSRKLAGSHSGFGQPIDRYVRVARHAPPRTNPAINPVIAPPGSMTNTAVIVASRERSKALLENSSIAQ
jgi:hypothetical protein